MTCSKSSESAPGSVMEVQNGIYGILVGFERVAVNRDRVHNLLQKFQCGINVLMPVEWDKTSRKQLRYRLAWESRVTTFPDPCSRTKIRSSGASAAKAYRASPCHGVP